MATGTIVFNGTPPLQIPAGASPGDVLTSDADGNVSWAAAGAAATTLTSIPAASGTVNLDPTSTGVFAVTQTGNTTFTFIANPYLTAGFACSFTLYLYMDATGGWSTTWPASVTWVGGIVPTLTTSTSALNLLIFETVDGGVTWYGSLVTESPAVPVTVANGGTGQVTAAAALSALGGAGVAGDLGGTSAVPQVTATHLATALPVAQGGTAATTAGAALTSLGVTAAIAASAATLAPIAGVSGVFSVGGKLTLNGGTSTAGSAPVLTPGFTNGVVARLTDTTRDYQLYLQIGTPGTAFSVLIGPTSTPATTVYASATPPAGALLTIRIPAGYYLKWAGTSTTLASQTAIGC